MNKTWWDASLNESNMAWFREAVGDVDHPVRVIIRDFLKSFDQQISLLDLGCGPCIEYEGYRKDSINVDYTGVDSSEFLLQTAKIRNPEMKVILSDFQTNLEDESFDVVLVRHILEHQEDFTRVIKEAVRLSKRYVIVVTFREGKETIINLTSHIRRLASKGYSVYDNTIGSDDLKKCFEENHLHVSQKTVYGNNTIYITKQG